MSFKLWFGLMFFNNIPKLDNFLLRMSLKIKKMFFISKLELKKYHIKKIFNNWYFKHRNFQAFNIKIYSAKINIA